MQTDRQSVGTSVVLQGERVLDQTADTYRWQQGRESGTEREREGREGGRRKGEREKEGWGREGEREGRAREGKRERGGREGEGREGMREKEGREGWREGGIQQVKRSKEMTWDQMKTGRRTIEKEGMRRKRNTSFPIYLQR